MFEGPKRPVREKIIHINLMVLNKMKTLPKPKDILPKDIQTFFD